MKTSWPLFALSIAALHVATACSGSKQDAGGVVDGAGASSGSGRVAGAGGGGQSAGGQGDGGQGDGGQGGDPGPPIPAPLQGLPTLTNVVAAPGHDGVNVTFDPFDNALDYRIYPLPDAADITQAADGSLTIKNAIYRCAGDRQTDAATTNDTPEPQNGPPQTRFDPDPSKNVLGYVYLTAGPGRVPVYAVGGLASGENGWREGRPKYYLTDTNYRSTLLAQSRSTGVSSPTDNKLNAPDYGAWRDDGIAFYVPAAAGASTVPMYFSETCTLVPTSNPGTQQCRFYHFPASELGMHTEMSSPGYSNVVAPAVVWNVLTAPADGAVPLYRVRYPGGYSGPSVPHDELVAGLERFKRAAYQGNSPLWALHWAGLTAPTTLVIEALDQGCPFQGLLAPQHLDASYHPDGTPAHQPFLTLEEIQKASATGEVFVNGQHDAANRPRAVARSVVRVTPAPAPSLDWSASFSGSTPLAPFAKTPFPAGTHIGDQASERFTSADYDLAFYEFDVGTSKDGKTSWPTVSYGQMLGAFWVAYDDAAQDVTATVRLTPKAKATVSADASQFLHITMAVDIVTTDRRYPQILVSDLDAPVQDTSSPTAGTTVIVQPIGGASNRVELQAFKGYINGKPWAVNNQSPHLTLADGNATSPAADPPFEHAGIDRTATFEVYLSSDHAYVLLDGQPLGCANLAGQPVPVGPVSVTFGDVIYHEGAADEGVVYTPLPFGFLHAHQAVETKRHFEALGFQSGVPAPAWDAGRFPCGTTFQ